MTVFKHEMRLSWKSLLIWSLSIAALMVICVLLFPEMRGEMEGVSEIFSSMGSFTAAFGMDKLNFGTFIGFYGIECGNILGLGGAFSAGLAFFRHTRQIEQEDNRKKGPPPLSFNEHD